MPQSEVFFEVSVSTSGEGPAQHLSGSPTVLCQKSPYQYKESKQTHLRTERDLDWWCGGGRSARKGEGWRVGHGEGSGDARHRWGTNELLLAACSLIPPTSVQPNMREPLRRVGDGFGLYLSREWMIDVLSRHLPLDRTPHSSQNITNDCNHQNAQLSKQPFLDLTVHLLKKKGESLLRAVDWCSAARWPVTGEKNRTIHVDKNEPPCSTTQ